ncbi:MAG: TonB-dependent receptor [Rhodobacteraceae bacterium]|nr:TonB-dependent receptor [Paracoccaceae bacterium]
MRFIFPLLCVCNALTIVAHVMGAQAMAQTTASPSGAVLRVGDFEEIVVTATRSPQLLYKIGSSVTVLDKPAIDKTQIVAVSELLALTPGVTFSRNGGTGSTTALRIRGAETDQTAVVIDGVKLNDPAAPGGGYNFGNMLVGDIDRIEILRGAQSTLWGSQAIGGVVNMVTAVPDQPFEAAFDAEGGARGTAYGRAGLGGTSDRVTWRLAGAYFTDGGFSTFANGREDDGYRNIGMSGRADAALSDQVSLDLRAVYSDARTDLDGFPAPVFAFADTREYEKTQEFVGYAGVNFATSGGRLKNRIAYSYTDTDRGNFNPDQTVTDRTFIARGRNNRIEYQGTYAVAPGWTSVFGLEYERSSFETSAPSPFDPEPVPLRAHVGLTSGYAQVQGDIAQGLTLTAGLRYDDHETFGHQLLGQVAAAWALNDGDTVLRASFGQGFKAPTLYQLYSIFGNLNLQPEDADSWDAGIEHHLLDDTVALSAVAFYRKTKNQIDFVSCPGANPLCVVGLFGVYDNIARTRAKGIELAATVEMDSVTVGANYTYTDAENRVSGNSNFGKHLARRPNHVANLTADYAMTEAISAGLTVRAVGKAFDNPSNTNVLKSYTVVDLRASWQITDVAEVYARMENVFDQTYQTTRDYGTAGRGVFAGVRARF